MRTEGIVYLKICKDPTWNRTRNLPHCVVQPQPTAPPLTTPPSAKIPRTGSNQETIIFVGDDVNNTYVLYYTLLIIMSVVVVSSVNIGAVKLIGN
jgi:hypothetical protein